MVGGFFGSFVATGRYYLRSIRAQILIVAVVLSVNALESWGIVPAREVLLDGLHQAYEKYGAPLVFGVSLVENIVGLNAYFPGSVIILASMAMTAGSPAVALLTWLMIWSGCIVGNMCDYHLGRWRKTVSSSRASSGRGLREILTLCLLTMWHPHYGALSSAALGAEGVRFATFMLGMLLGSALWYLFWGVAMYMLGEKFNGTEGVFGLYFVAIGIWVLVDLVKAAREEKKRK